VKLRGRVMAQAALSSDEAFQSVPMRPNRCRGLTLSPRARGAKPLMSHGPSNGC
jgi:hypothetical protein